MSSATPIEIGETLYGFIGLDDEIDHFAFTATEGQTYQIDLTPQGLDHPRLYLLDANAGYLDGADTRLVWSSSESGDYFVVVSGYKLGEYSVRLKLLK